MNPKPDLIVPVVAGVIFNSSQQILVAKRPTDKPLGGLWELPGGKIEPNESAFEALQRELAEEIDIQVTQAEFILTTCHRYDTKTIDLQFWRVLAYQGQAKGHEGQQIAWIELSDLRSFEFPPGNQQIIQYLLSFSK